jgi:hypothetical protein
MAHVECADVIAMEAGGVVRGEGRYSINHHCAVCCTDAGILAIFVSCPEDQLAHMSRSRRKEEKYMIRYESIVDIDMKKVATSDSSAPTDRPVQKPATVSAKDSQRISTVLYLKSERSGKAPTACTITAFESTQLSKYILFSWYSYTVHRAAGVGPRITTGEPEIMEDFLMETVTCLALGDFVKNPQIGSKLEALNDFADEVILDLELKAACFRSRELFMNLLLLCEACFVAKSSVLPENIKPLPLTVQIEESRVRDRSSSMQRSNSNAFDESRTRDRSTSVGASNYRRDSGVSGVGSAPTTLKEAVDSELQRRLQEVAYERLSLVRGSLKTILNILVFSECVDGRSSLIVGMAPLDLDSWLSLLTGDCYIRICKNLDCAPQGGSDDDDVKDINKQIELGVVLSRQSLVSPTVNDNQGSGSSYSLSRSDSISNLASPHTNPRKSYNVSESLTTPAKSGPGSTGNGKGGVSISLSKGIHHSVCDLINSELPRPNMYPTGYSLICVTVWFCSEKKCI